MNRSTEATAMDIRIVDGDIHLLDIRTRMPFRYGIATMTRTPHAFVRLRTEVEGRPSVGVAADHLPPKWFTKDPARPIDDEVAEMLRVIEHAVRIAAGVRGRSPFEAWRQVHDAQGAWGRDERLPPLLTQFGTSLVERALIEAVCRHARRPFHQLLRSDAFGIRLGDIHPDLGDRRPADLVPDSPPPRDIGVRHTVGLGDPLSDADVPADEWLDDGLPQSLSACIRAYGLRAFKIKVSGALDRDRERLRRVARVIEADVLAPYLERLRAAPGGALFGPEFLARKARGHLAFTLDGNEQFHSLDEFRAFWEGLLADAELRPFFQYLRFVEQPLHRDVALDPGVARLNEWPDRPPIIIDESDGELDSFPRALALGYAGSSHKNCKGVFKGVANACLGWHLFREGRGAGLRMSVEDLANIGPVALLQDLAVCTALHYHDCERNGHHYFAGLSMFPSAVQRQVLSAHGDLYHPSRDGWPTLAIAEGSVAVGSVNSAPFGVGFVLDVEQFTPLEEWRRSHPG
jgi:hypothetical protein